MRITKGRDMKKKKGLSLSLKAIETVYQGCRFRSRLEARWAIFFDALGIPWKYEVEGYDLEGTWYLPDFWLPTYDSFVEIKAQAPTEEEVEKASKLCLYSGKEVHLQFGDVWPEGSNRYYTWSWTPPKLWKYHKDGSLGDSSTEQVDVPYDLLILREKVEYCCVKIDLGENDELLVTPEKYDHQLSDYLDVVQDQIQVLKFLQEIYGTRKEEVLDAFIPDEGWEYDFFGVNQIGLFKWAECNLCGKIDLLLGMGHNHASNGNERCAGKFITDSPRLMSAYKAARSARFEHGEKP